MFCKLLGAVDAPGGVRPPNSGCIHERRDRESPRPISDHRDCGEAGVALARAYESPSRRQPKTPPGAAGHRTSSTLQLRDVGSCHAVPTYQVRRERTAPSKRLSRLAVLSYRGPTPEQRTMKSLHAIAPLVLWPALAFGGDSGANAPPRPGAASSAASSPRTARELCSREPGFLGREVCMEARCEEPRFRTTPDCATYRIPHQTDSRRL